MNKVNKVNPANTVSTTANKVSNSQLIEQLESFKAFIEHHIEHQDLQIKSDTDVRRKFYENHQFINRNVFKEIVILFIQMSDDNIIHTIEQLQSLLNEGPLEQNMWTDLIRRIGSVIESSNVTATNTKSKYADCIQLIDKSNQGFIKQFVTQLSQPDRAYSVEMLDCFLYLLNNPLKELIMQYMLRGDKTVIQELHKFITATKGDEKYTQLFNDYIEQLDTAHKTGYVLFMIDEINEFLDNCETK